MLIQLDALPRGQVLLNTENVTFAVASPDGGSRIFFNGPGHVDVPHDLSDLQRQIANAQAGRDVDDDGPEGHAGF